MGFGTTRIRMNCDLFSICLDRKTVQNNAFFLRLITVGTTQQHNLNTDTHTDTSTKRRAELAPDQLIGAPACMYHATQEPTRVPPLTKLNPPN